MPAARLTGILSALLLASATFAGGQVPPENRDASPGPEALRRAGTRNPDDFLDFHARSYSPEISGDIAFVPAPGVFFTIRNYPRNHGSPWAYDAEVPLFFYGPRQIQAGTHPEPAQTRDVAPTLAAALGIPPLPGASATAHTGILEPRRESLRAVLVVVMDQVGIHDLELHRDALPNLTRMRARGADFPSVYLDQVPTFTGVSHAGIATGAPPAVHGVVNSFMANADRTGIDVTISQGRGRVDPSFLKVPTLADWLDRHYRNRSVVLTQIYADYAATAISGHGASRRGADHDLVVWYDKATGKLTTDERWFSIPSYMAKRSIQPLLAQGKALPADDPFAAFATSARGLPNTAGYARWEADGMLEMMVREGVGRDAIPDIVHVNLKSTDGFGHQRGHGDPGYLACLKEIDRFVGAAEHLLDRRAGEGRWVMAITSDHGLVPDDGLPRYGPDLAKWANQILDHKGNRDGQGPIIGIDGYNVFLNHARRRADHVGVKTIRNLLLQDPHVIRAWTKDEIAARARELGFGASSE